MSAQARLCLAGGLRLAGGGLRVRSVQRWGACVPPPAPAVRGSPTVAVGVTSAAATGTYPSVWRPVFRRLVQLFTRPLFPDPSTASASITRTMGADQKRSHGGHSHGHGHHHHHHDNTYLTSSNKNDAGVRITRIGLFSNLGMAFAKGAGGYAFGSQALIADAWHSLTDLASDVLTLATVSWSLKPPTDAFPAGFGKVESLGSLGVSSMLLGGGLFIGQNYLVDVELAVPGDWTVDEAREVEAAVRERVGAKVRGVRRVRVRYVPKEAPVAGKFDEYISGEVSQRASPESEDEDEHDHDHDHGHANGNGNEHANGNGHSHANGNGNGNGHAHEKHQ
ncbi:hypothetical protein VdG2_06060 [Verticillium dahliae VDG2]|nr:hypothetical protein VdG2_06060 [Verticillium dahliae VDG2]